MASCENCYKAFEAGYEEAELAYINADRAKIVADAHQMTQDLQRIAQELGIGARPYSGHEAMERDILPEIRRLRQVEAVYESIVTRKARQLGALIDAAIRGAEVEHGKWIRREEAQGD